MNTKKILAAMVVMIMAASCFVMVPAEITADTETDDSKTIDLKVGEVVGTKMSGYYDMGDAMKQVGPAIKMVIEDCAKSQGISVDDFVNAICSMLTEQSAELLKKIMADPQGTAITKADFIKLANEFLSMMNIKINDINFSVSYDIIDATKRLAEKEYRDISTINAKIKLTVDVSMAQTNVVLQNAELNVRCIEESTISFNPTKTGVSTSGELDITFTGKSNFINDAATSVKEMFVLSTDVKAFNLPLTIKEKISFGLSTPEGFVLPTKLGETSETKILADMSVNSEITSTNNLLKEYFKDHHTSYSDSYTLPATVKYAEADDNITENHYETTLYHTDKETQELILVGTVCSGDTVFAAAFDYKGVEIVGTIDTKEPNAYFYIAIGQEDEEEEEEDIPTVPEEDKILAGDMSVDNTSFLEKLTGVYTIKFDKDTYIITVNGTEYDLTSLFKEIQKSDVRYGADYILTDDEVKQFEKDVSKTAYALNFDIIGFNGENLNTNPDSEPECPLNDNLRIVFVIVIAAIIAIAILAFTRKRPSA